MNKPIIIVAGPTASGKTSLAIDLAKKFNGEIVNADSRSIYREMDVATSKPTTEERQEIPHHLIDIVKPDETFSLSDYKKLANSAISEIQNRGKIPFLVGGTGLYLDSIAYDYNLAETKPNLVLRKELEKSSTTELAEKLKLLDPNTYKIIDLKNKRRLIRAIEVASQTNESFTSLQTKKPKPANILYLVLDVPRDVIYKRIGQRIEKWHTEGLVKEAEDLTKKYSINLPSMSAIGYKEIGEYINHKVSLPEALENMKKKTRNYAKRQITWFGKNKDIIYIKNGKEATRIIEIFLK
ncbi:MAG: tRNA (adenosine(37)-N6)-dimethylallyltransferase MiaA [Patescibacteria group bacterium]